MGNCYLLYPFIRFNIAFMPVWGQLNLQEGSRVIIELLNYFHDYMIIILLIIIVFVRYIFLEVIKSTRLDRYTIDSHILETIWTIVPMVILCFMAFPSLYLLYLMEDVSNISLSVKVVGHQWYWEYQYFNSWFSSGFDSYIIHDASSYRLFHALDVDNRLILPSKVNLMFLVSSADVLHSWTVPSLGIKVDAIPGRLNSLITMRSFSGVFFGQCREICGSNHSYMPVVVEFVPCEVYSSYISTQ